jgi:hypothetical protein
MADARLIDSTIAKSAVTTPAGTELVRLIEDPAGTPVSRKITTANVKAYCTAFLAENAAGFRTGTAVDEALTAGAVWDAAALVALTDAATVAVDLATGINFSLTIGGNRTLGNPTNPKVGQTGIIQITQSTGSHTLAYSSNWEFVGGSAPVLSTAASAKDVLVYKVLTSTSIYAELRKALA